MLIELELDGPRLRARHAALLPGDLRRRATSSSERYGLELIRSRGDQRRRAAGCATAPNLWERNPDRCCRIRKVEPLERALEPRRVDHAASAASSRRRAPTRRRSSWSRALRALEGNPLADWDDEARARPTSVEQRAPVQPAARHGLPVDRLHPLHAAGAPRRGRARRPLVELGQDRVRHPRSRGAGTTAATEQCRDGGFVALVHRPLRRRQVDDRRARRAGARARAACSSTRSTATSCATHLSKGLGFSKEDRDTNIERIGWVASRLARAGATVVVSAISPYEETRRKARALVEEHAHVRRGPRRDVGRGVRAPRREGPLREGVRRRDPGVHRRLRPVRGAGRPGAAPRDRGPRRPPESARIVLDAARGARTRPDGGGRMSVAAIPQTLSHLDELESEAIHIMREVAAERERPVLLFSGGKDSIVLLRLAEKAFRPGQVPVPGHARRHRAQLPRGDRVPRPPRRRARRAARRRERAGVDRQGPRRRADRAARVAQPAADDDAARRDRGARLRRGDGRRAPRRGARPREGAHLQLPRRLRPVEPARAAARAVEPLQRAASARASTSASSRSRTGRSSTSGSTSPASSSSCRRSTSPTSARCSAATG